MTNAKGIVSNTLNICFWIASLALVINLAYRMVPVSKVTAQVSSSPAPPTPFTAVLKETTYSQDNKATPTMIQTWAVRSDGSRSFQVQSIDPHETRPSGTRQIDFSSGQRVTLGIYNQEKSTTTYGNSQAYSWVRSPSSNCLDTLTGKPMTAGQKLIGHETVDGLNTVKIVLNNMTWWFAPEYGCAPVKFVARWDGGGRSEQDLVSLTPGEPPAMLFNVPASFREVSASTLFMDVRGSNCAGCGAPISILQKLDDQYRAHHDQ